MEITALVKEQYSSMTHDELVELVLRYQRNLHYTRAKLNAEGSLCCRFGYILLKLTELVDKLSESKPDLEP